MFSYDLGRQRVQLSLKTHAAEAFIQKWWKRTLKTYKEKERKQKNKQPTDFHTITVFFSFLCLTFRNMKRKDF